jgi:PAS domain S-box-containing protein
MRATPWPQITHPEDVTPLLIPFQRMAAGELDFYSTEKRFLHKDGHYVWSRLTLSLVRDEQGRPDYEIAIIENINARKRAEEHLRESQEALHLAVQQFETLANTMPQIVWSTRPDGYHDYFNDRWYEFTGMPREEGQGWNWWNYLHPDDIGPTLEVWNRSLATGEPYEVQYRFRRASDGVYRWFITRAMPIHDLNGKVSRWFGTCTDITEQKETEEALRRSEQRHRTLFDSGLIGTYYANINGKIIEANNKFLQMLGYTREELNAGLIRWTELTPPEFREGDAQVVAELKTSGITRRPYEKEYLRKDGTRLPVIVGTAKVDEAQYDTVAFVLDISERKRTEAALRRRHEHLQLLHQATARLLIGQQPAELIRQLHSQIAKTFGAEAFMLYQSNGDGSLHLEACEGFDEEQKRQLEKLRDGRAICGGSEEALQPIIATHIQSREAPNRHFVRKLGFRSYLYYPLVLNNRLHGSLAFGSRQRDSYDRSDLEFFQTIARTLAEALERQHLQRELQRHTAELESIVRERTAKLQDTVAELEGFSYSIVHDMRAPLRAMQGYASILEEKTGPRLQAKEGDLLRKIKMAANRMDQLITDSLNYTRILRQELPVGVVNLGALLRSMVETYPNLQPPEAEIRLDIGDLMVRGNEAALTQVFSNLLGNAVKFVDRGVKPRVHVWAEVQDQRNSARVYIQDNGIGIPKEAHQKIFGMFQRLHRANEYPGTGIGLALVRKSLQRTGGEISVDSEPGKGSRFCVQLPLAQVVINTTEIEKAA